MTEEVAHNEAVGTTHLSSIEKGMATLAQKVVQLLQLRQKLLRFLLAGRVLEQLYKGWKKLTANLIWHAGGPNVRLWVLRAQVGHYVSRVRDPFFSILENRNSALLRLLKDPIGLVCQVDVLSVIVQSLQVKLDVVPRLLGVVSSIKKRPILKASQICWQLVCM
jgi:hypothetical protein